MNSMNNSNNSNNVERTNKKFFFKNASVLLEALLKPLHSFTVSGLGCRKQILMWPCKSFYVLFPELTWLIWPSLHALSLQMLLWWVLDKSRGGSIGSIGEGLVQRSGAGRWAGDVAVGVAIAHETWGRGIRVVLKCCWGTLGIGGSVVHIWWCERGGHLRREHKAGLYEGLRVYILRHQPVHTEIRVNTQIGHDAILQTWIKWKLLAISQSC